jgi:OmpA-OmpF porin, OOP family
MKMQMMVTAGMLLLMSAGAAKCETEVKDHPLVSRFPGSQVVEHKSLEFDEYQLALGPIMDTNKFTKDQHLEGKVSEFKYSVPEAGSSLEIERAYETALRGNGFQVLFSCGGKQCFSDKFSYGYTNGSWGIWCGNCEQPMRYLAAKLARPAGDVYVSVVVEKDHYEGGTWLSIVEVKHMDEGLVRVDAAALARDIMETGHASLYGLYFDTGKSTVKPESDPTLAEIAKLLASNPQLKLDVVGHTDNIGTTASNMALSKQRADAVLQALVTRYHAPEERLQAAGLGPMAPIASNRSEDGRAKNRRVELVAQ